jgi:hypothetical protein
MSNIPPWSCLSKSNIPIRLILSCLLFSAPTVSSSTGTGSTSGCVAGNVKKSTPRVSKKALHVFRKRGGNLVVVLSYICVHFSVSWTQSNPIILRSPVFPELLSVYLARV